MSIGAEIIRAVEAEKILRAEVYSYHTNRASDLAHPCLRYLVHCRMHYQERPAPDVGLQTIFDEGELHERAVLHELAQAGIGVIKQQHAFKWEREGVLLATGHIDAVGIVGDVRVVLEVKSMAPHIWMATHTLDDLRNAKRLWLRKYPGQMAMYIDGAELDHGVFVLKNKSSGRLKCIDCQPDDAEVNRLLDRAEEINRHVAEKTWPDRPEWDEDICGRCDFLTVCMPDHDFGPGAMVLEDAALEKLLDRREECAKAKKEYEDITKKIKAGVEAGRETLVGNWVVDTTGKRLNIKRRNET
jgi:hypothetical protein